MDKKDCLYCENKETLDSLMIYITDLKVSKLYLFKEQTYYGRCVIAFKDHAVELYDVSAEDAALLMEDVKTVGRAVNRTVNPAKVNYGMYSDKLPHLHVHVVPKQMDGHSWGTTFVMNPEEKYLSDDEYADLIKKIKSNL